MLYTFLAHITQKNMLLIRSLIIIIKIKEMVRNEGVRLD